MCCVTTHCNTKKRRGYTVQETTVFVARGYACGAVCCSVLQRAAMCCHAKETRTHITRHYGIRVSHVSLTSLLRLVCVTTHCNMSHYKTLRYSWKEDIQEKRICMKRNQNTHTKRDKKDITERETPKEHWDAKRALYLQLVTGACFM